MCFGSASHHPTESFVISLEFLRKRYCTSSYSSDTLRISAGREVNPVPFVGRIHRASIPGLSLRPRALIENR